MLRDTDYPLEPPPRHPATPPHRRDRSSLLWSGLWPSHGTRTSLSPFTLPSPTASDDDVQQSFTRVRWCAPVSDWCGFMRLRRSACVRWCSRVLASELTRLWPLFTYQAA